MKCLGIFTDKVETLGKLKLGKNTVPVERPSTFDNIFYPDVRGGGGKGVYKIFNQTRVQRPCDLAGGPTLSIRQRREKGLAGSLARGVWEATFTPEGADATGEETTKGPIVTLSNTHKGQGK